MTTSILDNQLFFQIITFIYTCQLFLSVCVFFLVCKGDRRVGTLVMVFLLGLLWLCLESKKLVLISYLVKIKIPHFLHPEEGLNWERWDTITFCFTLSNISILITLVAVVAVIAVVCLSSQWKNDKNNITLIYAFSLILFLFSFYAMVDNGSILKLAIQLNSFSVNILKYLYSIFDNVESLQTLATKIEGINLSDWIEKEFILYRLLPLPFIFCLPVIPLQLYHWYQYLRNGLLNRGITTYQVAHILRVLVIPSIYCWVVQSQPCPVVDKVFRYQLSGLIEMLSCHQEVVLMGFLFLIFMGFLFLIFLIRSRRVTVKSLEKWCKFTVALIFFVCIMLSLNYLTITILDTTFVKNLLLGLVYLGILLPNPPGTLSIPVSQMMIMNMNDHRLQAQRSGLPPSQQASLRDTAGAGLRGQPSLLGGELISDPTQDAEDWINRNRIDINDPRLEIHRSGLPPSNQAGAAGPTLTFSRGGGVISDPTQRGLQPSQQASLRDAAGSGLRGHPPSLGGELIYAPTQKVENTTYIDKLFERTRARRLPELYGRDAALTWALMDMKDRMSRGQSSSGPELIDLWDQLSKASNAQLLTCHQLNLLMTELEHIRPQVNSFQPIDMNLHHELGSGFKGIQEKTNISVEFFLTVLLQGEMTERLSTLSQRNKNSTSRLMSDLLNHPKLIHNILLKERLNDLNNILTGQGSFRFPFDPLNSIPQSDIIETELMKTGMKTEKLLVLLRSMFDHYNNPVYHKVEPFNESRNDNDWALITEGFVASEIAGDLSGLPLVEEKLGPTHQIQKLKSILATLDGFPKREDFENIICWDDAVREYLKEKLLGVPYWIKSFFKYEVSVLNLLEWFQVTHPGINNQVEIAKTGRVEKIIQLLLLEKGLNNLEMDTIQNTTVLPRDFSELDFIRKNTALLPVLRDIINKLLQLLESETKT